MGGAGEWGWQERGLEAEGMQMSPRQGGGEILGQWPSLWSSWDV